MVYKIKHGLHGVAIFNKLDILDILVKLVKLVRLVYLGFSEESVPKNIMLS